MSGSVGQRHWSQQQWTRSILDRLDRSGDCWLWTGQKCPKGYGIIRPRNGVHRPALRVHRVVYESLVGPIPDGTELDHLCRTRLCANPNHLEPVSHGENVKRGWPFRQKAECPRGHPYNNENMRLRVSRGWTERNYYRKLAA